MARRKKWAPSSWGRFEVEPPPRRTPLPLRTLVELSQIVAAVTALAGVLAIVYQLQQVQSSIRDATIVSVYSSANGITTMLAQVPESREFFYDDDRSEPHASREVRLRARFATLSPDLRARLRYAAEFMADNFEQMYWLRDDLPPLDWEVWLRYFRDTYRDCFLVREVYLHRPHWYNLDEVLAGTSDEPP